MLKKKIRAILTTVCLSMSIVACGGTSEQPAEGTESEASTEATADASAEPAADDDFKVGVSFKTLQEERWVIELDEIQKVCDEQGIEMVYQISENDIQKQVGQIENLISQEVDMLIVLAGEKIPLTSVLQEAHDAGIVVCYYEQVGGETYFDFSGGNDYFEIGQAITKPIAETGISGDVAYLYGDATGGGAVVDFHDGMFDSLKDNDINIIGEQYVVNWDPATAMSYTENWLTDYSDSIKAILCMNDGMAGGAIKALENEGLAGQVLVCGQDADLEACKRIVAGTQYSTVMKGGAPFARQFTETAIKFTKGELTAEDFDTVDTDNLGQEKPFMVYPGTIITKDNIDSVIIDAGIYTHEQVYGN